MKILVVDNYDSFTYNLVHYLEQGNCEVEVIRNDEDYSMAIENCDAVVLSPGPGLPPQSGKLMEIIGMVTSNKPILGVCLGMQALAIHFGGSLKNLSQVYHGKQSILNILETSSPLFQFIPNQCCIGHYHSWVVNGRDLPKELIVTSESLNGEIMSVQHTSLPIYGVQFHPESVLTEYGMQIIQNWLKIVNLKSEEKRSIT